MEPVNVLLHWDHWSSVGLPPASHALPVHVLVHEYYWSPVDLIPVLWRRDGEGEGGRGGGRERGREGATDVEIHDHDSKPKGGLKYDTLNITYT